jgi:hypothetical protein
MGVGNVASRCSKGKRGKMPPHQCTLGSICGVCGLSFGCHFAPKGGGRGSITKHIEMLAVDV